MTTGSVQYGLARLSQVRVTPPVSVMTFINNHHHITATTPPSNDKHRRTQEHKEAGREGAWQGGYLCGHKRCTALFLFYFVFTNNKWGGSSSPFFSTRFDVTGEDMRPPWRFLTWKGRIQPLPTCFQCVLMQSGRAQPLPTLCDLFWQRVQPIPACYRHDSMRLGWAQPLPILCNPFWHKQGGFNPSLLVVDAVGEGMTPFPPWFDSIQCERGGFNPSPPVSTWFNANGEGTTPPTLFNPFQSERGGFTPSPLVWRAPVFFISFLFIFTNFFQYFSVPHRYRAVPIGTTRNRSDSEQTPNFRLESERFWAVLIGFRADSEWKLIAQNPIGSEWFQSES